MIRFLSRFESVSESRLEIVFHFASSEVPMLHSASFTTAHEFWLVIILNPRSKRQFWNMGVHL